MRLAIFLYCCSLLPGQDAALDEKIRSLDDALAAEVRRTSQPVDDAVIRQYVESVGQKLAAGTSVHWTFEVIGNAQGGSTAEPVSLPGGHIFVSTHLLAAAESEAEFAGMLAHVMAHVVAGHGAFPRARPVGQSSIPLIFMGGWSGLGAGDEQGIALPLSMLDARREWERAADHAALPMAAAAGFDPAALAAYVARTQRDVDPKFAVLARREQRVAEIERIAAGLTVAPQPPADGFLAARQHVVALIAAATAVTRREPPTLRRPRER